MITIINSHSQYGAYQRGKKLNLIKIYHQENLRTNQLWNEQLFPQKREVFYNFDTFYSTLFREFGISFVSQTSIFTRTVIKLDTNRTKNTHSHNI